MQTADHFGVGTRHTGRDSTLQRLEGSKDLVFFLGKLPLVLIKLDSAI